MNQNINKQQAKTLKKSLNLMVVKRKKLYEEARRLTPTEAFLILISVAVGIGYVQVSSFYIRDPWFYIYPTLTCIFNLLFGYLSVYLLLDAKALKEQLGSFQELAYYFTSDRAWIMLIGL